LLVVAGSLLLLDQKLKTHWLSLTIPILISFVLIYLGLISYRKLWLIPGFVLLGLSAAAFIVLQSRNSVELYRLFFWSLGLIAIAWLLLFLVLILIQKNKAWWALFVSLILGAVSYNFSQPTQTLLTYVLTISLAIGSSFLIWGVVNRKLGLLIPGLIISTIGSGVYFAWKENGIPNGLQETGIMLVWFSLGWIMITVCSRVFDKKFVWWPLIPGGILAMVGSGLYIGGNPENTLGFVRNTGSIGLILFGIYLILLKFGMKK
jgi:hypothetical protein